MKRRRVELPALLKRTLRLSCPAQRSTMPQHWFYDVWAFIGAGGAIVMVAILLTTDTFRSNPTEAMRV
jgi:hypothetical protein